MNGLKLIADSGSTKTDWLLISPRGEQYRFKTNGFNPYFQDSRAVYREIHRELLPGLERLSLPGLHTSELKVYFYGAGCSTPEKRRIIFDAIHRVFPDAFIEVEHDLLAAARALCGRNRGMAAILGTGSNSCFYDGNNIVENVASLGFILGDEGSGAHIGMAFMKDYLGDELPKSLAEKFDDSYKLNRELILDGIYKQAMPSRFLASFNKFISENRKDPHISELIRNSFSQFFDRHICKYQKHKEVDLNCVGSIAFHYQQELKDVASSKQVMLGRIIDSPMQGLIDFHLSV